MKRSLFVAANFVLILALVLSFGIVGCTGDEETTPATSTPATTSPAETTTPPPEETTTPPPETTTPPPEETTTPPAEPVSISWEEAADYIGVLVTVEGPVIDKWDIGTSMLLGMGKSAVEEGTVGIEISYALAAELPEDLYVGQTIQVTGTPYINPLGGASIVVSDASQIVVVEGPPPETTTPPEETTTPPPEETTTPAGANVYVSVSVDSELLLAAQPVAYTEGMTVDDVLAAAHEAYYSGGLDGYATYTDPIWGYMIEKCWGVETTPYIVVNDAPLQASVNAVDVAANDNIIIYTGADAMSINPVSLTASVSDGSVTITATVWTFSWTSFMWSSAPLADATVIDPTTGEVLGTTDANGQLTITIPASGIVAIEGMAAIDVNASST